MDYGAFKTVPSALDAHTADGVSGHNGQRAAAGESVIVAGIIAVSQMPCGRLAFGYVDGMRGVLRVVIQRTALKFDGGGDID